MTENDTGRESSEETDDSEQDLERARRQAILANPEGVDLPTIMDALDTLDDDQFEQWVDEHPEVRARVRARWQDMFDTLQELFETLPDEAKAEYNQRLELSIDNGLYNNTTLETAGGERYPAGLLSVWGTTFDGQRNIDIRERNIPDGVELVGSRIEIRNADGILLLAGEISKKGGRMAGEGIINTQTVLLEPDGFYPRLEGRT
jgi:hypothetical protein